MSSTKFYTPVAMGTASREEQDAYLAAAETPGFEGKGQEMTQAQRDRYFGQIAKLGAAMRASDARRDAGWTAPWVKA